MVKKANYCHYLRPPIDAYQTLDFAKYDTILVNYYLINILTFFLKNIGYIYGRERISELVQTNANIKDVMNPDKLRYLTRDSMRMNEKHKSMNNSFTDLAAVISRIPTSKNKKKSNELFEEDEDVYNEEFNNDDDEENGII